MMTIPKPPFPVDRQEVPEPKIHRIRSVYRVTEERILTRCSLIVDRTSQVCGPYTRAEVERMDYVEDGTPEPDSWTVEDNEWLLNGRKARP